MNTRTQNAGLAEEAEKWAKLCGLAIRHNASGLSQHDGYHRYIVHTPCKQQVSIRSTCALVYWETRYSKWGQPAIKSEAACLKAMITYLKEKYNEMSEFDKLKVQSKNMLIRGGLPRMLILE